jgi:hypothetical protein
MQQALVGLQIQQQRFYHTLHWPMQSSPSASIGTPHL